MPRPIVEGRRQPKINVNICFKPEVKEQIVKVANSLQLYLNEFVEFLFFYYLKKESEVESQEKEKGAIKKNDN